MIMVPPISATLVVRSVLQAQPAVRGVLTSAVTMNRTSAFAKQRQLNTLVSERDLVEAQIERAG